MHTLSQNAFVAAAFVPAALTNATQSGPAVDLEQASGGPARRATYLIQLAPGAATTANYNIQDSPDNSTWTTVTGGTLGTAQGASTTAVYMVDIDTAKRQRYIRLQIIGTGTAGTASAEIVLHELNYNSPTQSSTPVLL